MLVGVGVYNARKQPKTKENFLYPANITELDVQRRELRGRGALSSGEVRESEQIT